MASILYTLTAAASWALLGALLLLASALLVAICAALVEELGSVWRRSTATDWILRALVIVALLFALQVARALLA